MSVLGNPVAGAPGKFFPLLGWEDRADDEYTSGSPFALAGNTDTEFPCNGQAGVRTYKPSDIVDSLYVPSNILITGVSGTFQVGETITGGTSGSTAVITVVEANRLFLETINGDFQNAETITGGTSGATATTNGARVKGKITGLEGEMRLITLNCTVTPTNAGTTYIEFWFDIGGAVGELYRRIVSFPKGNGVARPITLTTNVYTLDTWEANGAEVYMRANNTANVYDCRLIVQRGFKV